MTGSPARPRRAPLVGDLGPVVATRAHTVALTFDDGPDRRFTPELLEVLDRHGVTATFFVLMTKVRRDPEVLGSVLDAGHEVGLHGPDHRRITSFGFRAALGRLRSARADLAAATGGDVTWYRPPYGELSATSFLAARRAGLTPVMWSATTWDWKDVSQDERLAKALSGARPGAILLAHDGAIDGSDGAPGEPWVDCDRPALLDAVLTGLCERRIAVGPVGAAVAAGGPDRSLRFLGQGLRRRGPR